MCLRGVAGGSSTSCLEDDLVHFAGGLGEDEDDHGGVGGEGN